MGDQTAENYVIIPDARDANVLLRFTSDGWTLPTVSVPRTGRFWRETQPVNAQLKSTLLLDATVLRCAAVYRRVDSGERVAVFVLEPHQLNWARPSGTDWFGPEDLETLELAEKEHGQILSAYFAQGVASEVQPWMERGWMGSTLSWLETEFQRIGLRCVATPVQKRSDSFGCLIELHTDRGGFELEALPPGAAHAVTLMQQLQRSHAGLVPRILAADAKRGLLFREPVSRADVPEEGTEGALRALARVQLEFRDRVESLVAGGALDLRTAGLAERIDAHFKRLAALTGEDDQVESSVLRRLGRRAKRYEKLAVELAELGLPDSLHHPTLAASMRGGTAGGVQISDWNVPVAHPFFSLAAFLNDRAVPSGERREELLEAYLSAFRSSFPQVDLSMALEHSLALLPVVTSIECVARHDVARSPWERAAEVEALVRMVEILAAD